MSIELLKAATLQLDRIDRIEFVQFILDSLAREEKNRFENMSLSKEQITTAKSRVQAIKDEQVATIPASKVKERLKRKYGFDS
ncbi:MAG: addiction module protein [Bacteroidota bacterium]